MEYAITAIQNAAAAVGVQCAEGIVVACEKRVASKLLAPPKASEKTYKLDEHVREAVAWVRRQRAELRGPLARRSQLMWQRAH